MKPSTKKSWRQKLARCSKGAISILLCLLMTPFLTISLALVEYARYQQVIELTDELEELTGISLLSDYDRYIHNRFGLLAVSQQQKLDEVATQYMSINAAALGAQIGVENTTATGDSSLALSNTEIIKRQILDVTETTGLASVLVEDFNIDELMNALQGLDQFTAMKNTLGGIQDLSNKIKEVVTEAQNLKTTLTNIQSAAENLVTDAESLVTKISDLYKKLCEKGYQYQLPDNLINIEPGSALDINTDALLESILGEYSEDIKDIIEVAKGLSGYVETIKTNVGNVPGHITTLETKINEAIELSEKLGDSGNSESKKATDQAGESMDALVDQIEGLLDGCLEKLKKSAIDTVKTAAEEIMKTTKGTFNLGEAGARWKEIANDTYFGPPPSETAINDLKDLLADLPDVWTDKSADAVLKTLKEKFVPDINFDFSTYIGSIDGILNQASTDLKDDADSNFFDTLTRLMNIIEGLFKMDVFYNADLNALTNIPESGLGPYQGFLNALSDAFLAVGDFVETMTNGDFFGMLTAVWDLCKAFITFIDALLDVIANTFQNMWDLISNFFEGNGFNNLYERLLMSGYAVHNFPNRCNAEWKKDYDYNNGNPTSRVSLSEEGLTGFSYQDIARPAQYIANNNPIQKGIDGFKTLFGTGIKKGSDTMFKGAEMEYIIAATNSELINQVIVFFNLYFLRLLCSLPGVFADAEVIEMAGAANVACWVVFLLYALIEPFADCLLLVNNETVPIVKIKCYLTPSKAADFAMQLAEGCMSDALLEEFEALDTTGGNSNGGSISTESAGDSSLSDDLLAVDYATHLLIMCLMNNTVDQTAERIKVLVELEAAEYYRQRNQKFDMNKTYTTLTVSSDVTFYAFVDLGLLSGSNPLDIQKRLYQVVTY